MIFVRKVICYIAMAAVLPNNVLTNNDIDPDYGKRVKLMNMEYGEILSSFENGEWTPKESRKMFRQANKIKMTHRMTGEMKKVTSRLFSTKCTTDRPIKMDKNYLPDTHEETSDDIQEHGNENKESSGDRQEKKSLENSENVDSFSKTKEENTLANDDNLVSNEPENNSIGDIKADMVEPENSSKEENESEEDGQKSNSIEENKMIMDGSYQEQEDRNPEISNDESQVEAASSPHPAKMKVQHTKKKIYVPPNPRKSPDHYIDDT